MSPVPALPPGFDPSPHPVVRTIKSVTALVGTLVLTFTVVWMYRYRFDKAGNRIVRVNRLTWQACFLQGDGTWDSNWGGTHTPAWVDAYKRGKAKIVQVPPGKEVTFDPSDLKPLLDPPLTVNSDGTASPANVIDKALAQPGVEAIETEPGTYMTVKAVEVAVAKYPLNACR